MSYTKQTWNTGDTITADKLNHMEDGIAAGGLMVISSTYDEQTELITLGKTWQEIFDALKAGVLCIVQSWDVGSSNSAYVGLACSAVGAINQYIVNVIVSGGSTTVTALVYTTNTADGYPSMEG